MKLEQKDDMTILIEWKNGKGKQKEYVQAVKAIADEFGLDTQVGPSGYFRTLIRVCDVPHRELESYVGMGDDEVAYDYSTVHKLIGKLKELPDKKYIYVVISEYERAGRTFIYEPIAHEMIYDNKGNPELMKLR